MKDKNMQQISSEAKTSSPGAAAAQSTRRPAPFFLRDDWIVFLITFLGAAGFYAYTQAPTVTLEDSGELVVAADYLGVPHPPGYPLWTIIAWIFTRIFSFVKYYGQPNPAWGVNFCSGVFGALTCAAAAMLVSRVGRNFPAPGADPADDREPGMIQRLIGAAAGLAAGGLLAFNSLFWSQSVIAEVYTINAFLHILVLLLAGMWIYRSKDNRILYWLSFIFGLSITNCQPIIFLGPAMLVVFFCTDRPLFRDLMALGLFAIGGYLLYTAQQPAPGGGPAPAHTLKTIIAILMLAAPGGIWLLSRKLLTEWRRIIIMALCFALGLSFFIYMPIASEFNPPMNWGYPRTWEGFKHAVSRGQYQALTPALNLKDFSRQFIMYLRELEIQFTFLMALAGILWVFILRRVRHCDRVWLATLTVAFLVLSIGMMVFLNPAHDVQSMFIARVQLVQAAAVYTIFIGYGLVTVLQSCTAALAGRLRRPLLALLLALAALSPLALLHKNYADEELVRNYGGAELREHDFGWQFGNYQLRGVEAIIEELAQGEEPPPNPAYPPPMGSNAVFYGGTDPGRFVPTYMIYSALVRPDVFLITQNALADNTYMNVMRDLYGDQIWIPTPQDVNAAFQSYVQDVQAGRIPPSASIVIDPSGKVSVQGVQGVMEINGIISKMIFEYNKWRHAFYVEESYVIAWMYPYMEPHGLILKINNEPLPGLTPEMVKNDMDFWDWYTRRLLASEKFQRDVTARKSFSKLRCAIAGLYAWRRMFDEAEIAFRQAVDLCPLSPEANFRMADFYLQLGRHGDALQLLEANLKLDPRNDKISGFMNQIREMEQMHRRAVELQNEISQGTATLDGVFELAAIFMRIGREPQFLDLARQIMQNTNLPPQAYLKLAELASPNASPARLDLMRTALDQYLQREPANAGAWKELACIQLAMGQRDQALQTLRRAVKVGGNPLREALRQDQRLAPLHTNPSFQQLLQPAAEPGFHPIPGLVF